MDLFLLIIFMIIAVLISVVINEFVPILSTPIIQIALGILLAIFVKTEILELDTELFLLLFISPILFNDGFDLDKRTFWDKKWPILSLAIGLVFAIVLVTGFFTNLIVPSIPLAAAFAFAAALGPTDPVAVSALTKRINIPDNQQVLLTGESLLNDASSLVSFQFALAAVVTGSFSAINAVSTTFATFVGGIIVGVVLMYLRSLIMRGVNNVGIYNPAFSAVFETITPFLVFVIAEAIGVSEIIAVVAAGIMYSMSSDRQRIVGAEDDVISQSVWNTLTFVLNSIVFVMMGILLIQVIPTVWTNPQISNWRLIAFVVAITLILYAVRFLWLLAIKTNEDVDDLGQVISDDLGRKNRLKSKLKSTLLMTFAGAKGVVTFAIVMSIPQLLITGEDFPERDLILFLATGVILLTMLVANFILPLMAETIKEEEVFKTSEVEALISLYNEMIITLGTKRTSENAKGINSLVGHYRRRIRRLRKEHDVEPRRHADINRQLIDWEYENVIVLIESQQVNPINGYLFIISLLRAKARLYKKFIFFDNFKFIFQCIKHFTKLEKERHYLKKAGEVLKPWPKIIDKENSFTNMWRKTTASIKKSNREYIIKQLEIILENPDGSKLFTEKELASLKKSYENKVISFASAPVLTKFIPGQEEFIFARYSAGDDSDLEDFAIQMERRGIHRLESAGKLSKKSASLLRNELAMRELDLSE